MYYCNTWDLSPHKYLEFQVDKFDTQIELVFGISFFKTLIYVQFFGLDIRITWKTDHAGLDISFHAPTGHYIGLVYYDNRHWDDDNNTWQK